ncbi:taurine catabolism dioxygenase [Sodiomyces alkalinus F11]|uniref:Taurine catabolism dioxygenase n=1 Tax=Sodiomyces alkalinus (strain CBS 110278 / VKM F-3762 / F11) TaxID=1314773 RepID=A0A3N2PUW3_SODAK|nr:taurine catabolism dioxygenase [Sodiomyces alkalinus F11]ROT38297.1 taurine catabolism dioxygenase [Sodiomyces alkalinus F11]
MSQLELIPQHDTFVAECRGVNWSKPISKEVKDQVQKAMDKYGVLIFRNTGLDDKRHIAFAALFGELDDMSPHLKVGRKLRLPDVEMFDVSNIDPDDNLITTSDPARIAMMKGNALWHSDLAFNSRRSGYSILRGHQLPPKGTGGDTEFLDARQAYDDLPQEMKQKIDGLVGNNSMWHNRKLAAPDYYKDLEPLDYPMSKHKMVTNHPATGRKMLFTPTYVHHIDGMSFEDSQALVKQLLDHASQPKYICRVEWLQDGDMIMWDNTAVMHRAVYDGSYFGKYRRDMRRTTSFDMGPEAHGLNDPNKTVRQGLNPVLTDKIVEPEVKVPAIKA